MKLKTILIAFLVISMITTVSACDFSDKPSDHWNENDCIGIIFDGHEHTPITQGIGYEPQIDIRPQGIGYDQIGNRPHIIEKEDIDIQTSATYGYRLPTQGEIEEIGETIIHPIPPSEAPEQQRHAEIILEHF